MAFVLFVILLLSTRRVYQLTKLRKKYENQLRGTDFSYFGVKIENYFGHYHWVVYLLVPFISASVHLKIEIIVRNFAYLLARHCPSRRYNPKGRERGGPGSSHFSRARIH